ncbi:MAG: hypothetical protein M4579_006655 [Chaenotheca gracillima]|nr:MAG: hypothetical protein M4579_006655 [Chaenotheca gracillima]
MSHIAEEPWQESEKLFLLAEILKDAQVPVGLFLGIILDAQIEPRWTEIPLPQGIFSQLASDPSLLMSAPSIRNASNQSYLLSDSRGQNPRKRPLPGPSRDLNTTPGSGARNLQPRPPGMLGSSLNGHDQQRSPFQFSPEEDPSQPPKKKRGRPSKADLEARAAAAAARGETLPPKPSATTTPNQAAARAKALSTGKSSAPGNISGATLMTPGGESTGTPGTGSVPRPRRGRPTKAESAAKRMLAEAAAAAAQSHTQSTTEGAQPGYLTADPEQHHDYAINDVYRTRPQTTDSRLRSIKHPNAPKENEK